MGLAHGLRRVGPPDVGKWSKDLIEHLKHGAVPDK